MPNQTRLTLDSDGPVSSPALDAHLDGAAGSDPTRRTLAGLIAGIAAACVPLAGRLAAGALPGDPNMIVGTNESGDRQKALDMGAHHHLIAALRGLSVASVLSEEAEDIIPLDPEGLFDVAMDPIDGSGSIGIGAPLGALFCVFPAGGGFLRCGRDVIAAVYVSFGHSTDLGFSMGDGVALATLDPATGTFHVDTPRVALPDRARTVAFNASNLRHWPDRLRRYVGDLMDGAEGPRGRDFNMRWIAAAVGELHRILRREGVFMYPADARPGNENGYLRLAYEAFPIAYLIEQAGGAATDGATPILDLTPAALHARVPLFFGARDEIATLHAYLTR